MAPDHISIEHIAALSNIALDEREALAFQREFEAIVAFIDTLEKVDTSETADTNQVTDLENVFRADDVVTFPHHRSVVEASGQRYGDLYKVPGVFSREDASHAE